MSSLPLALAIFGRQGSGKGTQSEMIVEDFGVVHISTGDMLRAAVSAGTDLGLKAKAVMDSGGLVEDELMIPIVAERLAQDDIQAAGVLLDGFPRTIAQAEALEDILGEGGLDAAINLDVPVDVVTERMVARGREDDTPEGIANRLALYEAETAPLLAWYEDHDVLHTVDGEGSTDEIFGRVRAVLRDIAS